MKRSILDLKHKQKPKPMVAISQLYDDTWRGAIFFPRAQEAMLIDRPTELGCENEVIHQCRKAGYHYGWTEWVDLQQGLEPSAYPRHD